MSRVRKIAIGAFVALLAATPFIPRGNDSDSAIRPSGEREHAEPGAPGPGVLTGAMRREIDRVVAAGRDLGAVSARQSHRRGSRATCVRCAEFEGQRYCLHTGWTTSTQADVRARVAAATMTGAARRVAAVETTGDLDLSDTLRRKLRSAPPSGRRPSARSSPQPPGRLPRYGCCGTRSRVSPLPTGFSAAHPEAGLSARSSSTTATGTKTFSDYPQVGKVLRWRRTAEQTTTYWCGPTTMQMIAWGWHGRAKVPGPLGEPPRYDDQRHGDHPDGPGGQREHRLGPCEPGRHLHHPGHLRLVLREVVTAQHAPHRGLPRPARAAPGAAQEVLPVPRRRRLRSLPGWPRLQQERGRADLRIGYFEPWNQQRFDPSEPYIGRVQWRDAYRSYRANRAHFQHNIGV